jgi:regulator of sigma E protease
LGNRILSGKVIFISTLISIGITILIFGVVVVIHEIGHFIAARKNGILVEEFAIGLGPKLYSIKKGETEYSLRLFPVGGFCRMLGDDEEVPDNPKAFNNKKVSGRMVVMLGGSIMNFLLAFIIFLFMCFANGFTLPVVRHPVEGMPAAQAGLMAGDKITHINNTRILVYEDFAFELSTSGGKPIEMRIQRDGKKHTLSVTPYTDEYGGYKIGFYPEYRLGLTNTPVEGYKRAGIGESVTTAFNRIVFFVKVTVVGIVRLITRTANMNEVAGPIGFYGIIDDTYQAMIQYSVSAMVYTMLNLCALLSANLGVLNLLPIPALDGGRLVFLTFEAIRRKPISPEREGMVHFVGFVLLMILAVFIAYQDIVKLL